MASPSGRMLSSFLGWEERLENCTWAYLHCFHFWPVAGPSHPTTSNARWGCWEILVWVQERRTGQRWYCVSLFQIDSAYLKHKGYLLGGYEQGQGVQEKVWRSQDLATLEGLWSRTLLESWLGPLPE